jgi:phage repressor protein C with HTH and peptisase S24 domain
MNETGCSAGTTEPYALRVLGDSMEPEFREGHIIIVDPGHPLCDEAFVVIEQMGEVHFGQYCRSASGDYLKYLNPNHPTIPIAHDFTLKGVIVQRSTGRRKDSKHYHYPSS